MDDGAAIIEAIAFERTPDLRNGGQTDAFRRERAVYRMLALAAFRRQFATSLRDQPQVVADSFFPPKTQSSLRGMRT